MHNKCIQISKEGLRLLLTGQTIVVKVGNPNRILEFAVNISSAMRNQIIPTIQHFFLQYFLRLVQFDLLLVFILTNFLVCQVYRVSQNWLPRENRHVPTTKETPN
jgi:antibiotic biosynthesis monooxygenase (ABM) superfamily enzyme